jgi:predicted anti-sigma-YlaC factor YlaD
MTIERDEYDLPCAALVEMVTDYLEGTLPPALRARVEEHLAICPGCVSVLEQVREVVHLTGRLTEVDVEAMPPGDRAQLTAAFRDLYRPR